MGMRIKEVNLPRCPKIDFETPGKGSFGFGWYTFLLSVSLDNIFSWDVIDVTW
jgi:hypothetical protein